jgi:drug/metabolite transporter (DMT)-like permease
MALEIGILFAIITMLSWGTADIFAKKAIDKIGYKTSLLLNHAIALGPLIILAVLFFKPPPLSLELVLITFSAGILGIIAYIFLYRGFQKGNVSIVSPISASWSVITTILAVFLFQETLTSLQIIGIVAVFIGIFFASTNFAEFKKSIKEGRSSGISDGLISMFTWGITYTLLRPLAIAFGPIIALLFIRIIAITLLFSWTKSTKTKISRPIRLIFLFIMAAGLLDLLGFIAFNFSISTAFLSIVGPVAATYPAVTIVLAYFFLKEKIVNNQKLGLIAILTGLALISLA